MSKINAYLTFNGNCREAMSFYRDCFGGDLRLQTVAESPLAARMPTGMKRFILHATLSNNQLILMASDMVGEEGLYKGNAVSLMLDCASKTEIEKYYTKLSEGGNKTQPLELTYWGAILGGLTDKYGNYWLLHFKNNL